MCIRDSGGKSEFNWQDVKEGKHGRRDDYLGACMKASVNGRRDKDRDFFWYNKTTDTLGRGMDRNPELVKAARRLEVLERRKADAAALADALGETAETRRRAAELDLEASELRSLLERGGTERDQILSTERVAGLGAAPARRHADASARVVAVLWRVPRHLRPLAESYFGTEHRKRCGGVQEEQSQHRVLPRHRCCCHKSAMLGRQGHSRASCEILLGELGSSANNKIICEF